MKDILSSMSKDDLYKRFLMLDNILCSSNNDNRWRFLSWCKVAEGMLRGEHQKSYQDTLRKANSLDTSNTEMDFLIDKAESSKPLEISQIKTGELLKYNITPQLQNMDPELVTDKDINIVNTYVKTMLSKTSYTYQLSACLQDALNFGTGVLKLDKHLNPSNYYKVHENIAVSYVPIKQIIVDDRVKEFQDMGYCGEMKLVNPRMFYDSMIDSEKETLWKMVDSGFVFSNNIDFATSYHDDAYDDYLILEGLRSDNYDINFWRANGKVKHYELYVKKIMPGMKTKIEKYKIFCGVVYSIEEIKGTLYPYQSITFYPVNNNFYGTSLLYLIFDDYTMHLRSKDAISRSLLFASAPVYETDMSTLRVDAQTAAGLIHIPGAMIPSLGGQSIRMLEHQSLTPEMVNAYNMSKQDMYDTAGLTKFTMGQSAGSLTTSSGVVAMIEQGSTATQVDIPNLEHFTKSIIELFLQTVSDYKLPIKAKITSNDAKNPSVKDINLISDMVDKIDVVVTTSSEQINQQNAITAFMQLLQVVPYTEDGSTDELRDYLITQVAEYMPINDLSKVRLKSDLLNTTEKVREARSQKTKEEMVQAIQFLSQNLPSSVLQGVDFSKYMK